VGISNKDKMPNYIEVESRQPPGEMKDHKQTLTQAVDSLIVRRGLAGLVGCPDPAWRGNDGWGTTCLTKAVYGLGMSRANGVQRIAEQ
jgi:hypothetical protein